jgi:peptidoglycan/xylan/chitin deacetylase (PgdA/CDA1 family)
VEWGEAAITTATGVSPRPLFRPPYGDYDQLLLEQLPRWGYSHLVMWTVDSLGWNGLSPADISERCLAAAEPGAIYLFHVGSASADHAALSDILDGLLNRGLQPVTVAELLVG